MAKSEMSNLREVRTFASVRLIVDKEIRDASWMRLYSEIFTCGTIL